MLRKSASLFVFLSGLNLILTGACLSQELPRDTEGRPFLQGIWQAQTRAAYDLEDHAARQDMPAGVSVVSTGTIPYQDWALSQRQDNVSSRMESDPLRSCYLPGVPRIMAMPWPFQIFQTDEHVAIAFEWTQVFRLIYTAGQEQLYPGFEHWMGDSRGYWEGDTLVVEVRDMNDRTWLDAAGNFHSAAAQITERYTMLDADTIKYEATIDDPEVFTEVWTISYTLSRQTQMSRLLEYQCQAEAEEVSGAFERVDNLWYPAPVPEDFSADVGADMPLPIARPVSERNSDGSPVITGLYNVGATVNYGLEKRENLPMFPPATGVVVDPADGVLPYRPWAREEMLERREPWRGYDDPTAHCFVAGIPRSHYVPSPLFILQPPGYVVILHERMSYRIIPLDGREHLSDNIRLWMGDAVGHWEGDTLIVESSNYNGKAWLNELGDIVSHAQTVVEYYTPVEEGRLNYRATVSDPIPYTRPWTIEFPLVQDFESELLEVACLEDNNDLEHLRDVRDEHRAGIQ